MSHHVAYGSSRVEYVWGVLDFFPDTDFPDIRNRTAVHSVNGSCMVIPQEVDKIRLYLQLDPKTGVVDEQGRLIKSAVNYEKLLEVAKKSFHPYRMEAIGPPEWWSIYKSKTALLSMTNYGLTVRQSDSRWPTTSLIMKGFSLRAMRVIRTVRAVHFCL
jgi:hypothetical protein